MKTTIDVNGKTLELANNAFTPILYRQIFHKDFLALFSTMISQNKEVISKARALTSVKAKLDNGEISKEEFIEKYSEIDFQESDLKIIDERADLISEITFIMNKQAQIEEAAKLVKLTEFDYYDFLSEFDRNSLRSAEIINKIISFWQNGTAGKVGSKNT